MMEAPDLPILAMLAKLETTTGHNIIWWMDTVAASGLKAQSQQVTFLATEHMLGHGFASLIVTLVAQRGSGPVRSRSA